MKTKVISFLYSMLSAYPEAPFNSKVIADNCQLTIDEVETVLNQMITEGLLKRKEGLGHTYLLSSEGLIEAEAWMHLSGMN